MEKQWHHKESPPADAVESLSKQLNINRELATLLLQRQISEFEQARTFFRPSLDQLHDPFLMKDLARAVNRIGDAIAQQEKILIYGDYDVDGTTSVALVYSFLRTFTPHVDFYIPDRYIEGYGISRQGIEWAAAKDFSLVIALDCGIRAFANSRLARELSIDLIVCDHHLPADELPDAYALLDPKRADCQYPYKELSGCGVGFKLLQGFCLQNSVPLTQLYAYLDLVAVSIASDIVPISGENRILTYYGLKKINTDPQPGIKALINVAGLRNELHISDVVFYLGPRINAAGRLTHARESVRLLISEDEAELADFAARLNKTNAERRTFDQSITREALAMIEENPSLREAKTTVLFHKDWHKGIVGIVASRCTEHYYRPTIILTESNQKATGSARSVEGFDIYEAISACSDLIEQFGGHTHAAGLTLPLENVEPFKRKFEEVVSQSITQSQLLPVLEIDLTVDFDFVQYKSFNILKQMAPFGPHNQQPIFESENVYCKYAPKILKEEHLKMTLHQKGGPSFEAIAFGMAHLAPRIDTVTPFRIAYHIDENEYMGNKSLQLTLKDIKFYH